MTLTAVDPVTGKRYYSADYINPKDQIPFYERLICPITNSPVNCYVEHSRSVKDGKTIVTAHFKRPGNKPWPEDLIEDDEYLKYGRIGESAEHRETKHLIRSNKGGLLFDALWDESYATTELRIPIPSKNKYRIADVALDSPGRKLVVEVQFSPISIHDLMERTDDYLDAGWDIHWAFGPKNSSQEKIQWHVDYIKYKPVIIQTVAESSAERSPTPYNAKSSPYGSIRNATQAQVALL